MGRRHGHVLGRPCSRCRSGVGHERGVLRPALHHLALVRHAHSRIPAALDGGVLHCHRPRVRPAVDEEIGLRSCDCQIYIYLFDNEKVEKNQQTRKRYIGIAIRSYLSTYVRSAAGAAAGNSCWRWGRPRTPRSSPR